MFYSNFIIKAILPLQMLQMNRNCVATANLTNKPRQIQHLKFEATILIMSVWFCFWKGFVYVYYIQRLP